MSVQTTDQSLQAGGKGRNGPRRKAREATDLSGRPQSVLTLLPILTLTCAFPLGQFYVMMTPQDVLQTGTQRTIAPRTHPYSPYVQKTWVQKQGTLGEPGVGLKEGRVFWNASQAVEATTGTRCIFGLFLLL